MEKLYTILSLLGFGLSVQGQDLTNELIPENGYSWGQGYTSYGYSTLYYPSLFRDGEVLNLSYFDDMGYDSLTCARTGDTIMVEHHRPFSNFSFITEKFLVEGDSTIKTMSVSLYDENGLLGASYEYKPHPILFSFPMSSGETITSSCDEYMWVEHQDSTLTSVSLMVQRTFVGYMTIASDFGFYPNLFCIREDWVRDDISVVRTNFFWFYKFSGIFFPIFRMYQYGELNVGEYAYIMETIPSSGSVGAPPFERIREELVVYPNPIQEGFVQIIIPEEKGELVMYSSNGALVKTFSKPRAGIVYWDISDLFPGMYILQAGSAFTKLVIY